MGTEMQNAAHDAHSYHSAAMRRVETTPAPDEQKFKPGARVRITDHLGTPMNYFPAGRLATVLHTYAHAFERDDERSLKLYCLDVDGIGSVAWYEEWQLTQA